MPLPVHAEFTAPHTPCVPSDRVLIAHGSTPGQETVASVALVRDGRVVARVDMLASAGASCFKDLRSIDGYVYIGFGRFVFVVDPDQARVRAYPLDGYFGHLYDARELDDAGGAMAVFATSASEVLAFDRKGNLIWTQAGLGVDGVVLHGAAAGRIDGAGDHDPPGGWQAFSLAADDGRILP